MAQDANSGANKMNKRTSPRPVSFQEDVAKFLIARERGVPD